MKKRFTITMLAVASVLSAVGQPAAPAADSADPYAQETPAQRDARMKWWREARFGMFIHWGVYSVPAGTYNGRRINGIGEWIMNRGKIPVAEYRQYAQEFNPVKYNAEEWVRIAKAAGMKYIVITSKHHDGFAMFDSKASDWNIVKATAFGRDPLKELAAACQKYGLKLGFYYSQAQDWNNPGGAASGGHWDKAQDGSMDDYIRNVAAPQVREILTHYGPIAVLWWDTPVNMNRERADMLLPLLKLQPGIINNNRLGGGYRGDTETPEQFIPATGFPGRDWETCMTMNNTWGYKSYDNNWKSPETLIRNLVDIASKGGNYLLNVGPTSEGLIPAPSVERLAAIGRWMKVNDEAIYATTASPFKKLPWGRCTKKLTDDGAVLYLHVFDWPADHRLLVPGLKNAVQSATLLSDGRSLFTYWSADGVTVLLPDQAPDTVSSTIVLRVNGPLSIEPVLQSQEADGSLKLAASDAICHGSKIKYETGRNRDQVGSWQDPGDWVEWQFKVTKPGQYDLTAEVAAAEGSSFEIRSGKENLRVEMPGTGSSTRFQKVDLGHLRLSRAGKTSLSIKPIQEGWHGLNLRALSLQPARLP